MNSLLQISLYLFYLTTELNN